MKNKSIGLELTSITILWDINKDLYVFCIGHKTISDCYMNGS